ncbi:MAG: GMC oxidoreductase [Terracidiphilus sp.]
MVLEGIVSSQQLWDVCIVGSGPVGMALALEFDRIGAPVLLLEAGVDEANPAPSDASRAQIVDSRRHAPVEIAVCRAFGGTSWTWGGRCVAYDDIDWIDRDFVPEAHWPLHHNDIRPWYEQAAEYLLCGKDEFEIPTGRNLTEGLTIEFVERWAREPRVILTHRERLVKSTHIHLSLRSTVTAINFSPDGERVENLTVSTPTGAVVVRAKRFVLALGGVETTRLLLCTQRKWPRHFGGIDGPLGRYYMGHISGKIADIVFDKSESAGDLDFKKDWQGTYYRRRFMLTADAQLKHRVLNTAFWPDNPPFYDPTHHSGVLSSVFLALVVPPIGRKLLPEGIRLAHTGPHPYRIGAHLRNAILGAPAAARDMYRVLRDRFIRKPKKPGFLLRNPAGKYALHYHGEQVPNFDSRITLDSTTDSFGMPRARIDLRFVEQDVESVLASHDLLNRALRANGIGRLEFRYPPEQLSEKVYEQASDGYHQVGTTRMGLDPFQSVVDPNLKIHGVDNLFVASSSVFPTTGQANSTLLAVAFAVRLAHHLHSLNEIGHTEPTVVTSLRRIDVVDDKLPHDPSALMSAIAELLVSEFDSAVPPVATT